MIKISNNIINQNSINVYAYLVPHPLSEDTYLEIEMMESLPGFDGRSAEEDEEGIHPFFRDNNRELYFEIEKVTENNFRDALINLWPLLNNYIIDSIQIAIDFTGMLFDRSTLAAYNYVDSKPEKGFYIFNLTRSYLMRQLKCIEDGKELSLKFTTTWEHELIHLLDHWEAIKTSIYRNSLLPDECFKYYLLQYRNEGIAELYYFLKGGIDEIKTLNDAKNRFEINIHKTKYFLDKKDMLSEKERNDIFDTIDFYEIGPWLICDILKHTEGSSDQEYISNMIISIENGKFLENDTIIKFIGKALRIKSEDYLNYINKYIL